VSARRAASVLATVLLLTGCGRTSPSPSVGPPSTEPASSLPDETLWSWSAITPATDQKGVGLDLVAIGPKGFAASSGGERTLWTSADGSAWRWRAAEPLAGGTIVDLLAEPDGTFLAAGFVSDQTGLLVRFDGEHADVAKVGGPQTIVTSVVSTDTGDVAAGGTLDGLSSTGMIWRATEAGAWDAVGGPRDALFGPFCFGRTGWMAVSNFGRAELGNARADLWLSGDGGTWRLGSSIVDATVEGILATDDGYFAAGAIGSAAHDLNPAMWHSTDGQTWAPMRRGDITGTMTEVVRWRDGFVAVGSTIDNPNHGLVWVSHDGVTWTDAKGVSLEGMRFADVATSASQLAIVGEKGGESLVLLATLPK
jgi:hypothetical protein